MLLGLNQVIKPNMPNIISLFILYLQGNNGLAAKKLFELMTEGPPIVAVLGPTLSYELTVVGQITPFYDVLQVSGV